MSERPLDGVLFANIGGGERRTWTTSAPLTSERWSAIVAEDNRRREAGEYDQPRTILLSPHGWQDWLDSGLAP